MLSGTSIRNIHKTLCQSWYSPQEWFHVSVAKIDRKALETLRSGDDIALWYGFVHVDGQ